MRCEDYPCCGHQPGECPVYNDEGKELCWDCLEKPIIRYGRCRECGIIWQRRQANIDKGLNDGIEEYAVEL